MFMAIAIFFFKQKTAYELRISDWSSDVCSSDLFPQRRRPQARPLGLAIEAYRRHEAARQLPIRQFKFLYPIHMSDLGIGEDFGIGINGSARHACRPEDFQPVFTTIALENIFKYCQKLTLFFGAFAWRSKPAVAQ